MLSKGSNEIAHGIRRCCRRELLDRLVRNALNVRITLDGGRNLQLSFEDYLLSTRNAEYFGRFELLELNLLYFLGTNGKLYV